MVSENLDASAKHILIIDDAEATRSLVSQALREAGYRVTAVEDPTQALSTIEVLRDKPQQVDMMLMDLVMRDRPAIDRSVAGPRYRSARHRDKRHG